MTTTIILVRHGETEWNRIERFRGRIDVPLNARGVQQAHMTAGFIAANWKPAAIYSSPLSRALATAQAIAVEQGLTPNQIPGLYDTNYGEWQGLTPDEVARRWPALFSQWYESPQTVTIPGGESLVEVRSRAITAVEKLAVNHNGEIILLVSHTDVIRLILMAMLDIENDHFWHLRQDNCAISLVEKTSDHYLIRSMNCIAHLNPEFTEKK